MSENSFYIGNLITRYLRNELSDLEKEDLDKWLLKSGENQVLFAELTEQQSLAPELEKYYSYDEKSVRKRIEEARFEHPGNKIVPGVHRVHFWKKYGWIAAASVATILGVGGYLMFFNRESIRPEIATDQMSADDVKPPQTNKATITLADGSTVYLDNAGNGELAKQGNVNVIKLNNGQVAYQAEKGELSKAIQFNTLSNPRGSKVIDMVLTDGSHVWLNAGSSVTYPVSFDGSERKVAITGEAYFEVVHDVRKPFRVTEGDMEITVLGTHFNVNAYDDEDAIRVTLLEGSVEVKSQKSKVKIVPGEQATIIDDGQLAINKTVDTEAVMAWKNGYFQLSGSGIKEIMRQVSRWYDVEIVYEGEIHGRRFGGQMARSANLSDLLRILKESNVNCRIEGRKVVVEQ